jgi:hypothetical protein
LGLGSGDGSRRTEMFCTSCGQNLPEGKDFCTNCGAAVGQASAAAASGVPAPGGVSALTGTPAPAGTPAPKGPPAQSKRTGLIAGIVVAAIIVVAAAGVGIWLALRGDDSAGQPVAGDSTLTTVMTPGDEGSLDGDGSGAADSLDPAIAAYRTAVENLLRELDFSHGRIPELADIINANLPDVPQPVYDELQMMADRVAVTSAAVETLGAPAGYEEANGWLLDAASHMSQRLLATMNGIQTAWYVGDTDPALPYFSEGRQQRDAYVDAIEEYYNIIPPGYLPGDPGVCDT